MRGQKRGTCKTCDGAIHFYPHLDEHGEPREVDGEIEGQWAHIMLDDWRDNPHVAEPADEVPAS